MANPLAKWGVSIVAGLFGLALAGAGAASPPEPTKPVDLARYLGRWYEIARVPNQFEKGADCEAPTADYEQDPNGQISVVQICHRGSPSGAETVYHAAGHILDPGVNARLKLTFFVLFSKEYWILDYARDYQWAIVGDRSGRFLWLLAKDPTVNAAARAEMLQSVRALGYDIARLEFPSQK
jgi:apolipoprotein D and lipocalin family protein